jgi:UDP-N-acetylbacillosamine N-acetyltransferase
VLIFSIREDTKPMLQERQGTSKVIFLGAGGIAIVAAEIARSRGFEIVGFLDDRAEKHGTVFCGATVLGGFDMLPALRQDVVQAVIAFGSCHGRITVAQKVLSYGYSLPNLVHLSAIVSHNTSLGRGAILMPGSIINSGTEVGSNLILNTAASVDHECSIGDGVHIGPGARLSGLVSIGTATWIGIGSIIRESVHIGSNVLVGAGALVLKDIPDGVVAYGSPAKVIRRNTEAAKP